MFVIALALYLVSSIVHHRIDFVAIHTHRDFLVVQRRELARYGANCFHVVQVVLIDVVALASVGMATELHTYQRHLLTGLERERWVR